MKVLVTGATGLVGQHLLPKLVEKHHELVVVSRDKKKAQMALTTPVQVYEWDTQREFPEEALDGAEAIINLMGENISGGRWTKSRKEKIYSSRVHTTEAIARAVQKHGQPIGRYLAASAIGLYPKNQDTEIDEKGEVAQDFLAQVCQDWEKASQTLPTKRLVIYRLGIVLAANGGALAKMLPLFRLGLGGPIGRGQQWMSWIHVNDLVDLFVEGLTNESFTGVINAVSPEPVTNKYFTEELAFQLEKSTFLPTPPLVLKLAFGEMSSLLIDGQKVVPKKLQQLGHQFKFPLLKVALQNLLSYEVHE